MNNVILPKSIQEKDTSSEHVVTLNAVALKSFLEAVEEQRAYVRARVPASDVDYVMANIQFAAFTSLDRWKNIRCKKTTLAGWVCGVAKNTVREFLRTEKPKVDGKNLCFISQDVSELNADLTHLIYDDNPSMDDCQSMMLKTLSLFRNEFTRQSNYKTYQYLVSCINAEIALPEDERVLMSETRDWLENSLRGVQPLFGPHSREIIKRSQQKIGKLRAA